MKRLSLTWSAPRPQLPLSVPSAKETARSLLTSLAAFSRLFDSTAANALPPHRLQFDCAIDLLPGSTPSSRNIYNLSVSEDLAMQDYVRTHLAKGFISPSNSPFGAPVFFVKKKNGDLRLCHDFRALNKMTRKDRNPIPLISDIIRQLSRGRVFTALDLKGAYNLLRIRAGDEHKTAFNTKLGQFQMNVMPFGLTNAPSQFQSWMNSLFRHLLGVSVVVYLDDIVIFSHDPSTHDADVRTVLDILLANDLFCNLAKCQFSVTSMSYLGYVISTDGVRMDPVKVAAVQSWPVPVNLKELQILLGFTNFYRRLIPAYASVVQPLTDLLRTGVPFPPPALFPSVALSQLKTLFSADAFLAHPDDSKPFVVETDASDFAISAILSQENNAGVLQPVAFYSRQMTPAERNYQIYDKELLAIFTAFSQWRHFLQGARHQVSVLCDHRNLVFFASSKVLSPRQVRWSQFMELTDFVITYRPGLFNTPSDALSRRPDFAVPVSTHSVHQLLSSANISPLGSNSLSLAALFSLSASASSLSDLHEKFGHVGDDMLRRTLASSTHFYYLPAKATRPPCTACLSNNTRKHNVPSSAPTPTRVLETISADITGPFSLEAIDGTTYNIKFVDQFSSFVKFQTLFSPSSAAALAVFQPFLTRLERVTNSRLLNVRVDQGGEFLKDFLAFTTSRGIVKQAGIAYDHTFPGKAERLHATIGNSSRAMLAASFLPPAYYCYSMAMAAYIHNRTVHAGATKTPFELVYGQPPVVAHLQPFGAVCYAFVPLEKRSKLSKLAPVRERCRLVGYLDSEQATISRGYQLLRESDHALVHSNDVLFPAILMTPLPCVLSTTAAPFDPVVPLKLSDSAPVPTASPPSSKPSFCYEEIPAPPAPNHPHYASTLLSADNILPTRSRRPRDTLV